MADFAAHLVDRVAPRVPLRQWVLTVPYPLRARMMFDPALATLVLREPIAAVSSWLRRRARRLGVRGLLKAGAIADVQRFNSALGASPHFHTLFLDRVYSFPPGRKPVFHPTPAPRDEDIARVAAAVCRRVARKLSGREPTPAQRRFEEGAQVWCALAGASADGIVATGARRGRYLLRVRGARGAVDATVTGPLGADVAGFNLQAATRIAANDRAGLERMARYLARPPIATDRSRVSTTAAWSRGSSGPGAMARPPSCLPPTSSSSVSSPSSHARAPTSPATSASSPRHSPVVRPSSGGIDEESTRPPGVSGAVEPAIAPVLRRRFPWASLILRVFLKEVLECTRCKGRMEIVAVLKSHASIERILAHLGLAVDGPEFHPARPPPQSELSSADEPAVFYPDPPVPEDSVG